MLAPCCNIWRATRDVDDLIVCSAASQKSKALPGSRCDGATQGATDAAEGATASAGPRTEVDTSGRFLQRIGEHFGSLGSPHLDREV